ncbi:hypothetical protein [Salinimonas lutimaris]|uniref:hypothetical protein n=1 Tax=Salinimonas lutimaris TaxID=914153 RepID=UPI0010C13DE1|nr:hypothetical protein [Salinimonas lutimaris]
MVKYLFSLLWVVPVLTGCIVVPQTDTAKVNKCEISSDRKTLKIINGFEDTNTFYSVSGLVLLPISGVVSGTYVAINNVYHLGEETLVCGAEKPTSEYS